MSDENPYVAPRPESLVVSNRHTARRQLRRTGGGWTILAILWGLFFVVVFGDIGFDHPGQFGLDFAHFLLMCVVYAALFGCGVVLALVRKRPRLGAALLASAALHCAVVLTTC